MRFLPYILAASMVAPLVIWFIVAMSLPGSTTRFWDQNIHELVLLVPMALLATGLMVWWMSRLIASTDGRKAQDPAE